MSLRKLRDALVLMGAFVALLWVLQVFNWADGYRLDVDFGIVPHNVSRLPEIFTAPFLHVSWQHIEGNTVPLFVLGVLAAYRGIKKFLLMTLIVAVSSGLAVWLFQSGSELTVGASGLIFGYFGYVVARGFFDRNLLDIGVGIVAGAAVLDDPAGGDPRDAGGQLDRAPRRAVRRGARGVAAAGADRGRRCFSPTPGRGAACRVPRRPAPRLPGSTRGAGRPRTCCASWRRRASRLGA